MNYQVGIDLGTTYTAAAVHRDEKASMFSLGSRAASIPSVVLLREDETILTGEAAVRRAITEPERVAREFKRRLGDTTPIIVGGSPYSAEALMARLLRSVLEEIIKREGSEPSRVAISHPANWGQYKLDLFRQAIRLAGLDEDATVTLTEPEAAAISYANQERVEVGQVVAVYDLGGGTFDACVLRRTTEGFEIIGKPEGIERLGGIDFDAAVFAHVSRSLDDALSELDPDDPTAMAAVSRLRVDCVDAKEALSSDTDATIPVLLPNLQTEVRLTRREFESVVRPSLVDSIESMRRAIASAGVEMSQVAKVLLVGGSSRIPLVAQMVASDLGRPVAVDAHPKHAIALGAAYAAAAADGDAQGPKGRSAAPVADRSRPSTPPAPGPPLATSPAVAAPAATPTPRPPATTPAPATPAAATAPPATTPPATAATPPSASSPAYPPPESPVPATPAAQPLARPTNSEAAPPREPMGPPPDSGARFDSAAREPVAGSSPSPAPSAPQHPAAGQGPDLIDLGSSDVTKPVANRMPVLLGIGAVVLLALVGGFFALRGGDDADTAAGDELDSSSSTTDASSDTTPPAGDDAATTETTAIPDSGSGEAQTKAEAVIEGAGLSDLVKVEVDPEGVATLTGTLGRSTSTKLLNDLKSDAGVSAFANDDSLVIVEEDEWCSPTVQANDRWACITSAVWDGTELKVQYDTENLGEPLNENGSYHYHFFPSETPVANSGLVADGAESQGNLAGSPGWDVWGDFAGYTTDLWGRPGKICVRIATPGHAVESLTSGNCWPVSDE